jgi:phosphohistidine phosphatase
MRRQGSCPHIKKGAVWWMRTREREGVVQTCSCTVQAPDAL